MDLENIIHSKKASNNKDLDIDSDDLKLQRKMKELEVEKFDSDIKDRKWLAKWSAFVVSIWLILVVVILFLNKCLLNLSDAVLMTLLGTTTLNILGLSFIVLRGHFGTTNKHS
jgi:hypothetical protein|nr:MAG TPA: hypothetical protein [Caudoviricetes sp.]DAR74232.1 MAG TPA: hypothetical protein [Caudoviricetes sp.]